MHVDSKLRFYLLALLIKQVLIRDLPRWQNSNARVSRQVEQVWYIIFVEHETLPLIKPLKRNVEPNFILTFELFSLNKQIKLKISPSLQLLQFVLCGLERLVE
jgi:hypothetical protein